VVLSLLVLIHPPTGTSFAKGQNNHIPSFGKGGLGWIKTSELKT